MEDKFKSLACLSWCTQSLDPGYIDASPLLGRLPGTPAKRRNWWTRRARTGPRVRKSSPASEGCEWFSLSTEPEPCGISTPHRRQFYADLIAVAAGGIVAPPTSAIRKAEQGGSAGINPDVILELFIGMKSRFAGDR